MRWSALASRRGRGGTRCVRERGREWGDLGLSICIITSREHRVPTMPCLPASAGRRIPTQGGPSSLACCSSLSLIFPPHPQGHAANHRRDHWRRWQAARRRSSSSSSSSSSSRKWRASDRGAGSRAALPVLPGGGGRLQNTTTGVHHAFVPPGSGRRRRQQQQQVRACVRHASAT